MTETVFVIGLLAAAILVVVGLLNWFLVQKWFSAQFPRELDRPTPDLQSSPTDPYRETPTCPTCGQSVQTTPR